MNVKSVEPKLTWRLRILRFIASHVCGCPSMLVLEERPANGETEARLSCIVVAPSVRSLARGVAAAGHIGDLRDEEDEDEDESLLNDDCSHTVH